MSPAVATTSTRLTSPLAPALERFLTLKRAMGYRYRDEARLVHELDRFLASRLSTTDPVLSLDMARAYVESRGGTADHPDVRWREFTRLLASPRLPGGLAPVPR